jgi:hypothetical protein
VTQDVLGLDVAMQHACRVRSRKRIGDTGEQLRDVAPRAPRAVRPVAQRSAVDELGDEVLVLLEFAGIVDREDVRVIQRRGHLRFALEAPQRRGVGPTRGEKLDRDLPIQSRVERAVDHAHAALAEEGFDLVRSDAFRSRITHRGVAASSISPARIHRNKSVMWLPYRTDP